MTCSCGSLRPCSPPPAPLPSPLAAPAPLPAPGKTPSRCASRPSSWVCRTAHAGQTVGREDPGTPREVEAGPAFPGPTSTHPGLTPDSDSDDEEAPFFSVGASSGAPPQPPAAEPSGPARSQSALSTLVTVLKGRVTALCEAKVRAPLGRGARPAPTHPTAPSSRIGALVCQGQRAPCSVTGRQTGQELFSFLENKHPLLPWGWGGGASW